MAEPGLGRRPAIDPRNDDHPMRRALHMSAKLGVVSEIILPKRRTWYFRGDPLNQGATGTCVAHTFAHLIHADPIGHIGFLDPFELYREIVLLDEYADNDHEASAQISGMQMGSSGTGGAKALHRRGLIEGGYVWSRSVEDIALWVRSRGCVAIGTNWYASMFSPTSEGFVVPGGRVGGGHEWLIRGIDMRRGLVICVNSWGPTWNAGATGCKPGQFLMSLESLARLMHEDGDAVSVVEVKKPGRIARLLRTEAEDY